MTHFPDSHPGHKEKVTGFLHKQLPGDVKIQTALFPCSPGLPLPSSSSHGLLLLPGLGLYLIHLLYSLEPNPWLTYDLFSLVYNVNI